MNRDSFLDALCILYFFIVVNLALASAWIARVDAGSQSRALFEQMEVRGK